MVVPRIAGPGRGMDANGVDPNGFDEHGFKLSAFTSTGRNAPVSPAFAGLVQSDSLGLRRAEPVEQEPPEKLFGRYRKIRSHGDGRKRVPVVLIVLVLLGVAGVGAGLRYLPHALSSNNSSAGTDQSGSPLAPLPFRSAPVTAGSVQTTGFYAWALVDLRTGEIDGSDNMTATNTGEGMVTAWLAADFLQRADAGGKTPSQSQLNDLTAMLRDSDSDAANRTYQADGGNASIQRLISTCKLTETTVASNNWANTAISARDTVRMGQCIAGGSAAGSKWTPWVLMTMREVRNSGDFGIRQALPSDVQSDIAIINGAVEASDHTWRVNCLAIGDTWALSVLQRFPSTGNNAADLAHTQHVCQETARLLRDADVSLN
jgi:hypothetical protein